MRQLQAREARGATPLVRLQLLGGAKLVDADGATRGVPQGLQPVIARFAIAGPTHREILMEQLWPEARPSQARKRLNTLVWRVRRFLSDNSLIDHGAGMLGFSHAVDSDVGRFEREQACDEGIPEAADEYRGELLPGCFDPWVVGERDRLRTLYLALLRRLVGHHVARGELDLAIQRGCQLCEADPLREDDQRELIRLFLQVGRRRDARRQYERCVAALAEELGVDPMPETVRVGAEILAPATSWRAGNGGAAASEELAAGSREAESAEELSSLLDQCRSMIKDVHGVIAQLEERLNRM